jgi:hypothetical protein
VTSSSFAKDREQWLRTVLELPSGIPSDDTFRQVMSALDPVAFQTCFLNWVRALMAATEGQLVAIDGKTVRRSFVREEGKSALHVVIGQRRTSWFWGKWPPTRRATRSLRFRSCSGCWTCRTRR